MKRIAIYSFLLFSAAVLFSASCHHIETLPAGAYAAWVQNSDNGLLQKKQIGEIEYSVQYKPLDFVVLQSQGKTVNKSEALNLKKEFEGMEYFTFRVKSISTKDVLHTESDDENS